MTGAAHAGNCLRLDFQDHHAIGDSAEVALEDYARALTGAQGAEALHARGHPSLVCGVHICGVSSLSARLIQDLEAFVRELPRGLRADGSEHAVKGG